MQQPPKDRFSISFFGLKAEAEGLKGIAGLLAALFLLCAARWFGIV